MIDVEPLVRAELDRHFPEPEPELMDWRDVLARADEPRRQRRRRLAALTVALATLLMLTITPLGGAIARSVDGFSNWLTGTPGEPVPPDAQRTFEQANRFPGDPQLRELLRVELDGRTFFLYGFETRQVVCLRVAVRALEGVGPQTACASRADLRRAGDLVLPVKANMSVGRLGPLPRAADDPPTIARYLLTFGLSAAEVAQVRVQTDSGSSAAVAGNGAFLHVFQPGRRGNWARSITATTTAGRSQDVPVSVQAAGQPPLATGLKLHGPATVERELTNGTIGWFVRREARGSSAHEAGLTGRLQCCSGFVRVIYPDPDDFLGVAVGDRTLSPGLSRPRSSPVPVPRLADDAVCFGVVTRGGLGTGCGAMQQLFRDGPLHLSWGFSGGGQQIWLVSGLASDDVARIEVFQGDGEHWHAPLRDNATAFRVQRAKFPARVVAYDKDDHVIGIRTIRGG
jgi:hypothetical protein